MLQSSLPSANDSLVKPQPVQRRANLPPGRRLQTLTVFGEPASRPYRCPNFYGPGSRHRDKRFELGQKGSFVAYAPRSKSIPRSTSHISSRQETSGGCIRRRLLPVPQEMKRHKRQRYLCAANICRACAPNRPDSPVAEPIHPLPRE